MHSKDNRGNDRQLWYVGNDVDDDDADVNNVSVSSGRGDIG